MIDIPLLWPKCKRLWSSKNLHAYWVFNGTLRLEKLLTAHNIEKIIASLNPNKAHGHENISIRMLKICGNTIFKPLELSFKQALTTSVFPSEWKKGNIVPCYKKGGKQNIKNYRPVSLLPICGKFFERLIFNEMLRFFSGE